MRRNAFAFILLVLALTAPRVAARAGLRRNKGAARETKACHGGSSLLQTSADRVEVRVATTVVVDEPKKIKPTYKYVGCYAIENAKEERLTPEVPPSSMTVHKCYNYCHGKEGGDDKAKFFLLKNGNECSCLPYINKNPSGNSGCSTPCEGDKDEKCGGPSVDSVYVMVDCPVLPESKVTALKKKQQKETLEKAEKEAKAVEKKKTDDLEAAVASAE